MLNSCRMRLSERTAFSQGGRRVVRPRARVAAWLVAFLCLAPTCCKSSDRQSHGGRDAARGGNGSSHSRDDIEPTAYRQSHHGAQHRAVNGQVRVEQQPDNPWATPHDCDVALSRGQAAKRQPGYARLVSWNIHWFPDGAPGHRHAEHAGTDIDWLACTLAWLSADAYALQEVKLDVESRQRLDALVDSLAHKTATPWTAHFDHCGQQGQHVVWLTADQHVKVKLLTQYDAINPQGPDCAEQLRPGLGLGLRFAGGLDLEAIAVHLKSGTTARDIDLRRRSWNAISTVMQEAAVRNQDNDLLVFGDFNSMGCDEDGDRVSSGQESSELAHLLHVSALPSHLVIPTGRAHTISSAGRGCWIT